MRSYKYKCDMCGTEIRDHDYEFSLRKGIYLFAVNAQPKMAVIGDDGLPFSSHHADLCRACIKDIVNRGQRVDPR